MQCTLCDETIEKGAEMLFYDLDYDGTSHVVPFHFECFLEVVDDVS